jgi:hypothetical protein
MDKDITRIRGSCHCRGVQFEVELANGLRSARRCDCSYCRMRGAVAVSAKLGGVSITAGEQLLSSSAAAFLRRDLKRGHHCEPFASPTNCCSST